MVMEQEERDAAVARQLALRIQKEEEERRRRVELHDIRVARQMQPSNEDYVSEDSDKEEKELRRQNHVSPPPPPLPPAMVHPASPTHLPLGDVNSVGLPDVTELAAAQFRGLSVREEWPPPPPQQQQEEDDEVDDEGEFNEEEHRRAQELRDELVTRVTLVNCAARVFERLIVYGHQQYRRKKPQVVRLITGRFHGAQCLIQHPHILEELAITCECTFVLQELARLLQQQEERLSGQELDQLDRDRLMAIEAQDKELAKLLQERERAKARRARERAKQKALLRKQQEAAAAEEEIRGETPTTPPPHHHPPSEHETSPRHRHRYPDPEAIEVLSPGESPLPNIAMAIDPTYSPHSTLSSSYQEFEEYDEGPVPPYMPIQGQRRTSSLEKKKKKQPKDGCKQQ
ncbi:ubiquitin protein ligase binding [Homalodisca vitripennis]|nr:ubiquitin protein ligase binding [Homalodisca vitripennis]